MVVVTTTLFGGILAGADVFTGLVVVFTGLVDVFATTGGEVDEAELGVVGSDDDVGAPLEVEEAELGVVGSENDVGAPLALAGAEEAAGPGIAN